jgi:predicted RNase H-like HicB family nuclease
MGDYVASDPALRGCHTQARNLDELLKRAREGIELYLDVGEEDGDSLEVLGFIKFPNDSI